MSYELRNKIKRNKIVDLELIDNYAHPQNLLLEVTNACNDKCIFCANRKMTRTRGMMNVDLAKRILKEGREIGINEAGFYATGEPLLHNRLEEIISAAKKNGYQYTYLTTNGALLTYDRSVELLDSGIDSVKFSINASNNIDYEFVHGVNEFDKVVENVKTFSKIRNMYYPDVKLYVSFVLTRQTVGTSKELNALLGEYVDEIIYQPVLNFSGCMNEIGPYLSLDGKGNYLPTSSVCPYPFKQAIISYEGYLTLCCLDYQNYMAVADLNHLSLQEGINCTLANKMRRRMIENSISGTLCDLCISNCAKDIKPLNQDLCSQVKMKEWCCDVSSVTERINQYQHNDE